MKCVGAVLAAVAAVTLHGCGGGGTTSSAPAPSAPTTTVAPSAPTVSTTTVITTTTTTTAPPDPMPTGPDGQFSGPDAALYMNNRYMSFDPDNDDSYMGVTIDMHNDMTFYCEANGTECLHGNADCRISASLYNKHMMISEGDTFVQTMDRPSGIVFNQSAVESQFAKCSYVYDGATDRKLNGGCGCGALGAGDCGNVMSAYNNHDCAYSADFVRNTCVNECEHGASTCLLAGPDTENVEPCWCSSPHLAAHFPNYDEDSTLQDQCYFKGMAFANDSSYTNSDETREMLKRRIVSQQTNGGHQNIGTSAAPEDRYKPTYWNEVVLDANVVFDVLNGDKPAHAVIAFVYDKSNSVAKQYAQTMADNFKFDYGMQKTVPIIAFDTSVNVTKTGPFSFESGEVASVTV